MFSFSKISLALGINVLLTSTTLPIQVVSSLPSTAVDEGIFENGRRGSLRGMDRRKLRKGQNRELAPAMSVKSTKSPTKSPTSFVEPAKVQEAPRVIVLPMSLEEFCSQQSMQIYASSSKAYSVAKEAVTMSTEVASLCSVFKPINLYFYRSTETLILNDFDPSMVGSQFIMTAYNEREGTVLNAECTVTSATPVDVAVTLEVGRLDVSSSMHPEPESWQGPFPFLIHSANCNYSICHGKPETDCFFFQSAGTFEYAGTAGTFEYAGRDGKFPFPAVTGSITGGLEFPFNNGSVAIKELKKGWLEVVIKQRDSSLERRPVQGTIAAKAFVKIGDR